jgi:malate synthase
MIEISEVAATFDVCNSCSRINPDSADVREVDLHATVTGRFAGETVAATFDRDQEFAFARERDRVLNVRYTGRLHNQRRVFVDRFIILDFGKVFVD